MQKFAWSCKKGKKKSETPGWSGRNYTLTHFINARELIPRNPVFSKLVKTSLNMLISVWFSSASSTSRVVDVYVRRIPHCPSQYHLRTTTSRKRWGGGLLNVVTATADDQPALTLKLPPFVLPIKARIWINTSVWEKIAKEFLLRCQVFRQSQSKLV